MRVANLVLAALVGLLAARSSPISTDDARRVGDKGGAVHSAPTLLGASGPAASPPAAGRHIMVLRSFYCSTGPGCSDPICGGNPRTAWNRDATVGDGCAVDPRAIPYGSVVVIDGKRYVADDTGGAMRRDWRERGIIHVDVRVAGRTHEEVRRMGVAWVEAEVIEP